MPLDITYFRHQSKIAHSWWERRDFLHNWWRIYRHDPYWVPPDYVALRRVLKPPHPRHLARMKPLLAQTEALHRPRREKASTLTGDLSSPMFERPVAAAIALGDPRRRDGTAYLALLRSVNDAGSLERLLEHLAEPLQARGYRRIIAPTGLSPHLGSGLLQDHWNHLPPLHTAYNPPYLPEVAGAVLRSRSQARLYHLPIPPELPPAPPARANLLPLEPARLAADLLPLLAAACPRWVDFAPPDEPEAAFLLEWLARWPLPGWLAQVDGQPAGFVLLQPDLAPRLRRAKGGRSLLWRLWLAWAAHRPVGRGRVIFAGVLPRWRGQGIGRQLLHRTMLTARQQGWQSLTIGPLPAASPGSKFLEHLGAQARQSYLLYTREL